MDRLARLGLQPLRAVWVLLAVAASPPIGDALDDRSTAVAVVAATLAAGAWGAGLVAVLVPRTASLTAVRVLVPGASVAAVLAAATAPASPLAVVAALLAAAATTLALAPWTTDAFVDGSSYGPERRFALRTPLAVALIAVVAWAVVVAGAVTGPLLLAAGRWVVGSVATAAGAAAAVAGVRSLHQLSRRWVVLVPTGLVVHDPITMPEPQLFLRQTVRHLGPATAGITDELVTEDLTAGASGLALELVLAEPVDLLVHEGRATATRPVHRVLFTPGRPGALLAAARGHRLPVG